MTAFIVAGNRTWMVNVAKIRHIKIVSENECIVTVDDENGTGFSTTIDELERVMPGTRLLLISHGSIEMADEERNQ